MKVLIIGGGVSGLGIASCAARRGYSVLLVERGRCGEQTSANSHCVIHGGFRYLKSLAIPRVVESLRAKAKLLQDNPEFVVPLPCVMPLNSRSVFSRISMKAAVSLYNRLSKAVTGDEQGARILSTAELEAAVPLLKGRDSTAALLWYDGLLRDHRALVAQKVAACRDAGVTILEGSFVEIIEEGSGGGLVVHIQGRERITADIVVNATGPWIDTIKFQPHTIKNFHPLNWCRAFNVVLDQELVQNYAFGLPSDEGRLFFFVPRGNVTAIGTAYLPLESRHGMTASVSEEEVAVFLRAAATTVGYEFTLKNVSRIESGILPIKELGPDGPMLYGAERIFTNRKNYIEVMSTKYTTFEMQAEQVVKCIVRLQKKRKKSNGG